MAGDFTKLPIIDVGPLLRKCNDPRMSAEDPDVFQVVKQLDEACRTFGCFYVTGHEVPFNLMQQVRDMVRKFFDLPYEEKLKINMTAATGYRGYQRIGGTVTHAAGPDLQEAINCYKEIKAGAYGALGKPVEGLNQWPLDPPNFKEMMKDYIHLCKELSRKIMRGIALGLGGSASEFEGERAGDAFWTMRLIGYPPISNQDHPQNKDTVFGCGAHRDYGLLTLLNQDDDITALQVRNSCGEWIPAAPVPGAFVCVVADMLQLYSNGLYKSAVHRVISSSRKYRVCVGFFYETNFDTKVEPLEICKENGDQVKNVKLSHVVYGERFIRKVQSIFSEN